ncbi:TIGR00730 family Rossman fold protein [Snodgrassella alvi]|uniref:Cytokinin riboside 5'-monophosphate phosphoribohydrolase n=1 Tax=Snodgrassella alvi SCGC AB-598-J21 TaxID=1385367 RepID=A0A074V6U8_9NEIS|nr:TIGR00730 family Rossman fold protein [Snodgrassella alvi]KEQ00901.1 putative Rossmann fold nucleotide-binding protein [Snodgrassella alvi SCGC AB-598-J21]OOX78420.1 Rossman fold protein, TIGR00730 family [Snodgrassella alvi]ORE99809.1 Rossman fold protein, TIGR00730 family [Snodgrassella alvi]WLT02138.1 TIGR00730 family Rossman fold protein [Snodgrassella alvi]
MKNIVVYCGSNLGQNKAYFDAAQQLGQEMAQQGYRLVYGGGNIGLMGTIATAVLEHGGEVIGVIPSFLKNLEGAHQGLTELYETTNMTERKNKMIELANGFIAMPGGLGTYEELFEVLSQAQLKLHPHPIGILNVAGFFDPLIQMLQNTVTAGFMPPENMDLLCQSAKPAELLEQMRLWQPRDAVKWVTPQWAQQTRETLC